jgi:prepilin-type N-terminal cleavage/methylation domain-containing protein
MPKANRQFGTSGLTLVELLVVITILLIVAGVVLPMAQPALKGRTVREAARQVQVFLAAAQAKAIANQEYMGVRFSRVDLAPDLPRYNHMDDIAYQLVEVKLPPPLQFATPIVAVPSADDKRRRDLVGFPATPPPSPPFPSGSEWKDVIEHSVISLGSSSVLFRVAVVPSVFVPGTISVYLESLSDTCGSAVSLPLYPPATPLPVKIYLGLTEPRFTVAGSADLPVGAYVDLSWSGTSDLRISPLLNRAKQGKFWDDGKPVTLVFGPDGSLHLIYGALDTGSVGASPVFRKKTDPSINPSVCSPFRPQSDVYLLVSGAPKRKERELTNLRPDSGSFWVIVSPETGTVTTTPNVGIDPTTNIPLDPTQYPAAYLEEWLHEVRSNASKAIGL